MSVISPKIMVHKLIINPKAKPMKQKASHYASDMNKLVSMKVRKLLEASFIKECYYSSQLANVVIVRKANGS